MADFTKGSKPGYPKTENFTDLSHYLGRGNSTSLSKQNTQMSELPPAGSHQIIENMAEDDSDGG